MRKYLILLLTLTACSPKVTMQRDIETETVTRTEYRDSTVSVPVPYESAETEARTGDTAKVETSVAVATVVPEREGYRLKLEHKRDAIIFKVISLPMQTVTTNRREVLTRTEQVVTNELTGWQRFLVSMGYILLGMVAAYVIKLLIRFGIKFI